MHVDIVLFPRVHFFFSICVQEILWKRSLKTQIPHFKIRIFSSEMTQNFKSSSTFPNTVCLLLLFLLFGWLVNWSQAVGTGTEIKVPVLKISPATYSIDLLCMPTEVAGRRSTKPEGILPSQLHDVFNCSISFRVLGGYLFIYFIVVLAPRFLSSSYKPREPCDYYM